MAFYQSYVIIPRKPSSTVVPTFGKICISQEWKTIVSVYIIISGGWKSVIDMKVSISEIWSSLI